MPVVFLFFLLKSLSFWSRFRNVGFLALGSIGQYRMMQVRGIKEWLVRVRGHIVDLRRCVDKRWWRVRGERKYAEKESR